MNDRQLAAYRFPLSRADGALDRRYWRRICCEGRWLSTMLTVNK